MSEIDPEVNVEPEVENVPMTEIEQAASEQGWSPDKGDLSALDFLKNGRQFRDRLSDQVRDLRTDNEKLYGIVAENITEQRQERHQTQQQTVEEQIRAAAEDGDTEKVIELTKQIQPAPAPVAAPPPGVEYIRQWRADNTWFNENTEMQSDAQGFYQVEQNKMQESGQVPDPAIILPKVRARIERLYPAQFEVTNPNSGRGSGGETTGKLKAGGDSGALKRSDLSEDEAAHLDEFIRMGMKEERLLQSIAKQRGLT